MKLSWLEVHNFKKHASAKWEFGENLTVIRGPNFAGKSSILKAIMYALFGTHAVPGKKAAMVRRGQTSMFVKLGIELSDARYMIKRTTSGAGVFRGEEDTPIASGESEVNEWVLDHLKVDRKTALHLAVSAQTETAALLSLGAPAINALVEKVSGADQVGILIEKVAEKTRGLTTTLEFSQAPDTEPLIASIKYTEEQIQEAEKEIQLAANVLELRTIELKQASDLLKGAHEERARINLAKSHHRSYLKALEDLKTLAIELDEQKTISGSMPKSSEKLQAKLEELRAEEKAETEKRLLRRQLTGWFKTTGQEWIEGEKKIPELTEVEDAWAKQSEVVDALKSQHDEALQVSSDLRKEHTKVYEALTASSCPTCKRAYDDCQDREHLQSEKARLDDLCRDQGLKITEVGTKLAAARSQLNALGQREKSLRALVPPAGYEEIYNQKLEQLEGLPEDNLGLDQAIKSVLTELSEVTAHNRAIEKAQEAVGRITAKIRKADVEAEEALELAKGHEALLPDLEVIERASDAAAAATRDAQKAFDAAEQRLRVEKLDLKGYQAALSDAQKAADDFKALSAKLGRWNAFRRWLTDNKGRMLSDLWASILAVASEFLTEATSGFATELVRSEAGEFSVVEDGEESPCDGGISGGMAAIAGTALKLALIELLPTAPEFLLLDEPSSELNDEYAAALAAALKGRGKQILLVTHRTGEEYLADQVIEI